MKEKLFSGRRKYLTIPLLIGLVAFAWPFLLGALLIYLATKIESKAFKYIAIFFVFIFSLPIGTGWVLGMTGHKASSQPAQQEVAGDKTVADSPTPTNSPTPSIQPTATPSASVTPTSIPTPTKTFPTPTKYIAPIATKAPTQSVVQPTQAPVQQNSGYSCNCSKTCEEISSCAEAQYQLNSCGCSVRDRDKDGIACDAAPLNCQN